MADPINDEPRALGRLVEHDERSRAFAAVSVPSPVSVHWERMTLPWDQGNLGCCTGMAMGGLLMTEPFWVPGRRFKVGTGISLYSDATKLDPFEGEWPSDDTGSSGLAVAKAARRNGWITSYAHAFGLGHALGALGLGPVLTGVNWYDSFNRPADDGMVEITPGAEVQGGHEVVVVGCDVDDQTIRLCNSWGRQWGDSGYFTMSWDTWDRLLHEQGDVTTVLVA